MQEGESCAELATREAQSLMINQMMAGWMANYLTRLLVSRDLDIYATYIDLVTGSARSMAIEEGTGPMTIDGALRRIERGDATVADAEELRQALAVKTVQVEALRMELDEARREVQSWRDLLYTLRERSKDYVAQRTETSLYAMIEVQREADRKLLAAAGEDAEGAVKSA